MKKKIINGILLVALLFAATSAFVSCKDNDSDVQTELLGKIANLEAQIKTLQNTVGTQGPQGPAGPQGPQGEQGPQGPQGPAGDVTDLSAQIDALQAQIDDLKGQTWASQADIDAAVAAIQEQIDAVAEKVNAIFKTAVTSLNIDAVKNPVFGFLSAPIDVQSNILVACYGEAASDVEFPVGSGKYIADAGDILTGEAGNAGKIYVTVNPSSVDFSGKVLTLENTAGEAAPVTIGALAESKEVLKFGWTRGENAFYEATATIPAEKLNDVAVNISKQDLLNLKDDVIALIKNHTRRSVANLVKELYSLYINNELTAYRLKATWGDENYSTFSETKIAALATQPLSYSFDPEGAITVKELEEIEDKITGQFTSDGNQITGTATDADGNTATVTVDADDKIEEAINKFWNVFNKLVINGVENVNYALQPCLLIQEGTKMSRANKHTYSGTIKLVPTSRTAEVFAPAYKKYIKVTSGLETLLDEVYDGSVKEIPFTLESGRTYEIEYQAVDFTGVTRVKNYTIYGK